MTLYQHNLLACWLIAATVWYKTNRGALPPTRQRAGAATMLGVMIMAFGLLGLFARPRDNIRNDRHGADRTDLLHCRAPDLVTLSGSPVQATVNSVSARSISFLLAIWEQSCLT